MSEIELKPCPFCSGKAQIVKTQSGYKQNPSTILDTWAVQCENKCCRTMEFGDRIFRKEDGEIIVEEDGVKEALI